MLRPGGRLPAQQRAIAGLPAGVEGQPDDPPTVAGPPEHEPVGAGDHLGAAGVALEDVGADDVRRHPRLVAGDVDDGRPEQALVGVQPAQRTRPLGDEVWPGDLVGCGARE
jgi:hypothetical protein